MVYKHCVRVCNVYASEPLTRPRFAAPKFTNSRANFVCSRISDSRCIKLVLAQEVLVAFKTSKPISSPGFDGIDV
jgi:hypothetical protein